MVKRLLILVAFVVALFAIADFIMRQVAEDKLASRVGDALDLDEKPELKLGGWPFVLRALDGNFPEVEVTADTLSSRGVVLEDVEVSLRDVRFDLGQIISGADRSVRTGGGSGTAALTAEALDEAARRAGVDVTFDFAGGEIVVTSGSFGQAAGTPTVSGRTLTIEAEGFPEPFNINLPSIGDATYESAEVDGDRLVVEVTLPPGRLSVE
jgi:LmeA-like phospholipid-binding